MPRKTNNPKVTTSVSIESALLELVKKQPGFILSHFINEQLKLALDVDEEEIKRLNTLERIQEEKARVNAQLYIIKEKERQLQEERDKKEEEAQKWKEI